MTSPTSERLNALIAQSTGAQQAFLAALVKVPSDNPPGDCAPHAAAAAALLEDLGFTVERHVVPADLVTAAGMVTATNLIVRHRFGEGPTVALNAHGDVVPPGAGWTQDPYGAAIVDGKMYGRGVAVSKSDFATYAFALDALKRSGLPLKGTVELHFTYDEEIGGEVGPGWIISQGLTKPDYVLSAGFAYGVVVAHNGCLHLEDAYRATLPALVSQVDGIGSPQITVGLISGGINTNVVPDRVTFRLDRRIVPEENPEGVEAEVRDVIAQAAARFPAARVSVRQILLARPLVPDDASLRMAEIIRRNAAEVLGEEIRAHGVPLYTDARLYAEAGFPVVLYGAGPRTIEEASGHRADENLRLTDLTLATRVVAATLAELLA
ncbi:MAG: peptidase M20 [Rhizobiales bacterium 32-66-8]|nr:MAG: peptidase M20 [Rhizobiales bacterium 32-66-8]